MLPAGPGDDHLTARCVTQREAQGGVEPESPGWQGREEEEVKLPPSGWLSAEEEEAAGDRRLGRMTSGDLAKVTSKVGCHTRCS